jgi:hypothetical protein
MAQAGLLLATPCLGFMAGALLFTRVASPGTRDRWLFRAAVLSTAALVPVWADPPVAIVAACFVAMGVGASFSAPLNAMFVRRVDPAFRGRAMGVAISGLLAAEGLGFVFAGALVQWGLTAAMATGLCGTIGTLGLAAVRWVPKTWLSAAAITR